MCRGLGKANEAEPLCRRALQIREGTYGADSPNAATALTALADVLKDMSRYASLHACSYVGLHASHCQIASVCAFSIQELTLQACFE